MHNPVQIYIYFLAQCFANHDHFTSIYLHLNIYNDAHLLEAQNAYMHMLIFYTQSMMLYQG